MRGDDLRFAGHAEFGEHVSGGLHGWPVGIAAHQDADQWPGRFCRAHAVKIERRNRTFGKKQNFNAKPQGREDLN